MNKVNSNIIALEKLWAKYERKYLRRYAIVKAARINLDSADKNDMHSPKHQAELRFFVKTCEVKIAAARIADTIYDLEKYLYGQTDRNRMSRYSRMMLQPLYGETKIQINC